MRFLRKAFLHKDALSIVEELPSYSDHQINMQSPSRLGGLAARTALIAAISITSVVTFISAQTTAQSKPTWATQKTGQKDDSRVARGKYIVEGIARCEQCHTPRDVAGSPDRNHTLEGAAVWLKSAEPNENWPLQAPRLAGNPPGTDAEMVRLLTTGIWKDGAYLRQPMPQFRMTTEDAEAVVAYLKSLNSAAK